jgi:hypothetical protein
VVEPVTPLMVEKSVVGGLMVERPEQTTIFK